MGTSRVFVEEGKTSVFAVSLDWPGWCRRAKSADLALESLDDYRDRYAKIPSITFRPGNLQVVATLKGNATTDFGAPDARGPFDETALTSKELSRQIALLQDCWTYFDDVVNHAPATLRRGPRGGGRDRDAVVDHVREAERAYCSRAGYRVAPRTPWDSTARGRGHDIAREDPGSEMAHTLRDSARRLAHRRSRLGDRGQERR